mgnify:CR=1 FL=1
MIFFLYHFCYAAETLGFLFFFFPFFSLCWFWVEKGAPEKWRLVKAHGKAVGLPTDDDMGNSEVGHNALGAGRIYAQG